MGRVGRMFSRGIRGLRRLGRGALRLGKSLLTKGLGKLMSLAKFAGPLLGLAIPGLGVASMLGSFGGAGGLFGSLAGGGLSSLTGGGLGSVFSGLTGINSPLLNAGLNLASNGFPGNIASSFQQDAGQNVAAPYVPTFDFNSPYATMAFGPQMGNFV